MSPTREKRTPDPRLAAIKILGQVIPADGQGRSLREALSQAPALPPSHNGLMRDISFGVCRHLRPLNHWLNGQLSKPLKANAQDVRLLLLAGIYELWWSDRPAHAIVNAYPELCRKLKAPWASGLCNAILRKASQVDAASALDEAKPAIRFSLPDWLWQQWQQDWPAHANDMAAASLLPPPMTLRVNRQQQTRQAALEALDGEGVAGQLTPFSIYLQPPRPVQQLPHFASGALSVQDEAAQLPVELLDAPATGRILDACAAPGGKTGQLCEKFPAASVTALELSAKRLARVAENLQRLGVSAELLNGDVTTPAAWWDGRPFDAILLDAPCSASGILRRQPDSKWHRKRGDIPVLVDLQARMLDALWPMLTPGGMLVYATCSVLRQENDQQVAAFLARTDDAVDVTATPENAANVAAGWQLLPQDNGPDGFYVACLRKASS